MKNSLLFFIFIFFSLSAFSSENTDKTYLSQGLFYFSYAAEIHWQKNTEQMVDSQNWGRFQLGLSLKRLGLQDKIIFLRFSNFSYSSEEGNISIQTKSNQLAMVFDGEISKVYSDEFSFNYGIGFTGRQNTINTAIATVGETDLSNIYYGVVTGLSLRAEYRFIWTQIEANLNFEQNLDLNPEPNIAFVLGLRI